MAYNAILSLYSIFMGPIQVCTVHVCACALLIVLPGTEPSTTLVFLVNGNGIGIQLSRPPTDTCTVCILCSLSL